MKLDPLRSTLCLLAISVLLADGAIAQPSDPLAAMDARAKSASGHAGKLSICVKDFGANSNPSLAVAHLDGQQTARMEVNTTTSGRVSSCNVVRSSGSERLDGTSCDWVKDHWRSLERCQDHKPQF